MEIQILENETLDLLNKIEKERELTLNLLEDLSKNLDKSKKEVLGPMIKDSILGYHWEKRDNNYIKERYQYLIEDLKRNLISYYELSSSYGAYLVGNKAPNFEIDYFKKLNYTLFRRNIWISFAECSSGFLRQKWELKDIKYHFEECPDSQCVYIGSNTLVKGKNFNHYKIDTAKGVLDTVLKILDDKEFQEEYYSNYYEYLNNIIEEYKRVRIYLYSIKNPRFISDVLNQYEVNKKKIIAKQRKRRGVKLEG